jgi:hypothetical protein
MIPISQVLERWLERFGVPSDQEDVPVRGLYRYQKDPMQYNIVCVDCKSIA